MSEGTSTRTTDELGRCFRALASEDRRRLLAELSPSADSTVIVPEEVNADGERLERVQHRFYHRHLPHLEDAGFIDWCRESDSVTRGPEYETIDPLLELMDAHSETLPGEWSPRYE